MPSNIISSFFTIKKAFSKTYPSFLTLKEGSTSHLGLLPSGKKRKTALRCSEPLRFMVVGPSKVYAMLCGLGPPGERWIGLLKCWFCGNLLITCRFLSFFLVVSRKKRIFVAKLNV